MKISCTYIPCLFDDSTWLRFESRNQTVISIFNSLFQKYPEVRNDPPNITIRINGKKIHPLLWAKPLNDGDEVLIIQEVGEIAILTAILTAVGVSATTAATISTVVGIAFAVFSIAYSIYSYCTAPKAPSTGKGLNSSPTYGWDGLQMQSRQGVPVPIVYGEHLLGGNLIECFITSVGSVNYLNMLLALSEGEIEGIMREDLTGLCASSGNKIMTATLNTAGSGYTSGMQVLTVVQAGSDGDGTVNVSVVAGKVTAVLGVVSGGHNYTLATGLATTGGGGTGCKIDITEVAPSDPPYILINDNLLSNFRGISWDWRTGTQNQTQLPGFGNICQTYNIGVRLTTLDEGSTPYLYTTVEDNVEYIEVRLRCPALFTLYKGTTLACSITVKIEHRLHDTSGWTLDSNFVMTGASSSAVRASYKIDNLTADRYDVRITDLSPGNITSGVGQIVREVYLDNIVEGKNQSVLAIYPHTALLALKIQATDQLSGGQIPNVLTRIRGIKTLNLDTGLPKVWTRNPIYCVNDLLVNKRYGVGDFISQANINNDQLILMAEHCDEIIGDGTKKGIDAIDATSITDNDYTFVAGDIGKYICCKEVTDTTVYAILLITSLTGDHKVNGTAGWKVGGVATGTPTDPWWEFGEKRYELDLVIDAQNAAFDCINQICGCFRATPIWNKDAIQILIDKKENPSYIFNMGNILEGSFKHSFNSEKSKPNWIAVDFADKNKKFQKESIDVVDYTAIIGGEPKRERNLSLIGATRESQIYREARYHLNSAKYQDEQISFKGAIDAIHMLPGDVVKFQHDVFQWGIGGRIVSATTTAITLDQPVTIGAGTYVITCKLSDDTLETKAITDTTPGVYTTVHCDAFTSPPPVYGLYAFGLITVEAKPFRIMSVMKTPENEIEVVATEYSDSVYSDTDVILKTPEYSSLPPPPAWPTDPPPVGTFTPIDPPVTGTVTNLTAVNGIRSVLLSWDSTLDPTFFTIQIWRSDTNDRAAASLIGTTLSNHYTDSTVLAGSTHYYWIRGVNDFDNTIVGEWEPAGATSGVSITADLTSTEDIDPFAVTRGTQYYSATGINVRTTTEVEIGTITVYTNDVNDSVWLWAECELLENPESGGLGKEGSDYNPITLRIRRDSLSGTIISGRTMNAFQYPWPPIILIGSDIPGGSVGAHIYKFTAVTDYDLCWAGKVGYMQFMGFAKSR
jgi:hypothetical protein